MKRTIAQDLEHVAARMREWVSRSDLPPGSAVALAAYEQAEAAAALAERWADLETSDQGE